MAGLIRRIAFRQIRPGGAGSKNVQNSIQHFAAIPPRTALAVLPALRFGNQWIQNRPLGVAQISGVAARHLPNILIQKWFMRCVLISLVGQPGQVAVAPKALVGANIARQVGLIRFCETIVPEFIQYFLQSPIGREELFARQSGSVQQVINLGEVRQVMVPVLPIELQQCVVEKLAMVVTETQHLKSTQQRKLAALDALKKSLLHQAFSGAL